MSYDLGELIKKALGDCSLYMAGPKIGVSYQAIQGWILRNRLPRTEWTGETNYCEQLEKLSKGRVTKEELLAKIGDKK